MKIAILYENKECIIISIGKLTLHPMFLIVSMNRVSMLVIFLILIVFLFVLFLLINHSILIIVIFILPKNNKYYM